MNIRHVTATSIWFEIWDKDEVDLSDDGKELYIGFDHNRYGRLYISVPVALVREVLEQAIIDKLPVVNEDDIQKALKEG